MGVLRYLIIVLLAWFSLAVHAEGTLDKQTVERLITTLDEAVQQHNAKALASHFTDDAEIILRFVGLPQAGLKYDAKGYQQRLAQAWSMPMDYHYQTKALSSQLSDDNLSAIIESIVIETVTLDGDEVMVTETKEKLHISQHQGQAKIHRLEAWLSVK